jgi:signal transduction histidine kinase
MSGGVGRLRLGSVFKRRTLVPVAVFVAVATLTLLVWRQQVDYRKSLLVRHTEDVCAQASRRLEVFVESHLRVASIFARRWSTHEGHDFSRKRFEDFASVVVEEQPGFHAIGLLPPDGGGAWAIPSDAWIATGALDPAGLGVLLAAAQSGEPVVSAPFEAEVGVIGFCAVVALSTKDESLGYLVVEFQAKDLIEDCFHERIRSEFDFAVKDGDLVLFLSSPEAAGVVFGGKGVRASSTVSVRNRSWQLTMVPRKDATVPAWSANISVPLFGAALSVGLSWLVFLLLGRMEMYRAARNQQARLSRKVLLAQEEERSRLSRDLHDELGQLLTATRLEMGWLEKRVPSTEEESSVFKNTVALVEQATEELRRMCRGLRPPLLDDLGFEPAIRLLVEEFRERTNLEVELDLALDEDAGPVSAEVGLAVYRILQESLTNVSRHARATMVKVLLHATPGDLTLEVSDNGTGFDSARPNAVHGSGLEGMRERAHLVGGTVEVQSVRNQGTRIVLRVSLAQTDKERTS